MVGLGNVDNTSDGDKSISSATQSALDTLNGHMLHRSGTAYYLPKFTNTRVMAKSDMQEDAVAQIGLGVSR